MNIFNTINSNNNSNVVENLNHTLNIYLKDEKQKLESISQLNNTYSFNKHFNEMFNVQKKELNIYKSNKKEHKYTTNRDSYRDKSKINKSIDHIKILNKIKNKPKNLLNTKKKKLNNSFDYNVNQSKQIFLKKKNTVNLNTNNIIIFKNENYYNNNNNNNINLNIKKKKDLNIKKKPEKTKKELFKRRMNYLKKEKTIVPNNTANITNKKSSKNQDLLNRLINGKKVKISMKDIYKSSIIKQNNIKKLKEEESKKKNLNREKLIEKNKKIKDYDKKLKLRMKKKK